MLRAFDFFEEGLIVLGLAFMTAMNFINVVSRYCFTNSFSFTEEITVMTFVWVSMLGIAAGFKRSSHLGMSYFVELFPQRIQARMALFSMCCSLAMMAVMIDEGVAMVEGQLLLGARTPALELPVVAQGLAIPAGGVLIALHALGAGYREFKRLSSGARSATDSMGGTSPCKE